MSDKKSVKCAEIARLQTIVRDMTVAYTDYHDPEYAKAVEDYLGFLLHFVGDAEFEWTDKRRSKIARLLEVRTPISTTEQLMKIDENMIPPVCFREMLLGDTTGPWLVPFTPMASSFLARYPFLKEYSV